MISSKTTSAAPQIILPPPPPARPTVATSFLAGSKLSDEWFLGTVMIDMAIIGYESIGPVIIHDLSTKKGPKDGILSGAGAGCMFETGVPIPVANAADSDEVVFEKWKSYGHQVQSSRKVIRNAVEDLLAGIMPTPFELPPLIPLGPFACAVSINPSCCSCTSLAHWIETGRLEKRKGSCGPLGFLLREASKSLERIRAKAKDKHWPVPSGAVGMIGPASKNMDGAILLKQLRKLNPNLPITAEMCGVTGGAGQNIDASIVLHQLRERFPDLIVTAEMCGMTGGAGQNIDASIVSANLPLMKRNPSQYSGSIRNHLKEQQAQHQNLIDLGVHFSVDGKACTPCEAHLELELKLKSLNSDKASTSASFSLQKAYERMGEQGNLRLVKVCSKLPTPTSPGENGFDIYAYLPPPALSTAQSASSSNGSSVVQEPVQPSAFTALMSSTGGPIKRTVSYNTARQAHTASRNGSFKCTWPGCTMAPFPRQDNMKNHLKLHTEGSNDVKRGRPSHK